MTVRLNGSCANFMGKATKGLYSSRQLSCVTPLFETKRVSNMAGIYIAPGVPHGWISNVVPILNVGWRVFPSADLIKLWSLWDRTCSESSSGSV